MPPGIHSLSLSLECVQNMWLAYNQYGKIDELSLQ